MAGCELGTLLLRKRVDLRRKKMSAKVVSTKERASYKD